MAAVLSSEMDGAERDKFFVEHIDDCRRMGIEVLLPNINEGHVDFRVASEGKIHFGLAAIKGVGFKAVEAIVKAREPNGPFQSLDDFFERVSAKDVGAGCAETLIRAGAFDCLDARKPNLLRNQLLCVLPRAIQSGQAKQDDRRRGQRGLFDQLETPGSQRPLQRRGHGPLMNLPDVAEMSDAELLADEKKALGFYMSSHPLARHAELLQALATHKVAELAAAPRKDGSHPGRHHRQRSGQERPEEPVGAHAHGQAHLRRLERHNPRDALARRVRQDGRPGQERPDRLGQGNARPPPRPRRAGRSAGSSPWSKGPPS